MNRQLKCALLSGAVMACAPLGQALAQTPTPIEAFGRMPTFSDVALSPSGNRMLGMYRTLDSKDYKFVVFDRSAGFNLLFSTEQTDELRVRNPVWLTDDRILFSVRFNAKRYGTDTVETRLMTLNPDTGEIIRLFKDRNRDEGLPVQFEDDIVSFDWSDPDSILVQYSQDGPDDRVYRVRTDKRRRHKTEQFEKRGIQDWRADEAGVIRSGWGIKEDKAQRLMVRTADDEWKDISHRVAEGTPSFRFVGFPVSRDKAFVASAHETDTSGLYIYDIATDTFEDRLFHDEELDVYDVVQQRGTGAALGASYAGGTKWFGDNFIRDVIDQMDRTFEGKSVSISDLNVPQTHAVISIRGKGRPNEYVLYDIESNRAMRLGAQYPELEGVELGRQIAVSYEARDGLTIPAYVTLPPGIASLDDAKNIPFVMHPHGGPSARDFAGFDFWTQAVVRRGYGVMQMNFRGSSGYGDSFEAAGDRQWGQAMQDDITDAAGWLVEQGHADPERLAIMGASYGGYASLMGAVRTPNLYQCAAAFAPVTDLPRLITTAKDYVGGEYRTRHIGRLWGDRSMLRDNSPALHADQIEVPILLVHGEEDRVVDIDQSRRMVTGMKRQDVSYRYVELPGGNHNLTVGNNRLTFLKELDAFLGDCLDG